jgi:hypothetical protein
MGFQQDLDASLSQGISSSLGMAWPFVNEYSINFDGADEYASTSADSTLATKSYSFWAKSDETGANPIFDHGDTREGAFRFNVSSGRPTLEVGLSFLRYWVDNSAQDDDNWHHHVVYIEHDDITNCKWYVDGVVQTADFTVSSGSGDVYTTGIRLGRVAANYFDGNLDEFAVFDGELSAAQIVEIYNAGTPASLTSYSPEAWWRMGDNDGGTGTTITDQGSGGNDATLVNDPTFSASTP